MNELEKAQRAAETAAAKVAELEHQEAEKARQMAAERDARQRELDTAFLAEWEALDTAAQEEGSKSAAQVVYEGGDVIQAVAHFWVQRAKRNAIRAHARSAFYRRHGEHPDDTFARELSEREMRLNLESAIGGAASMHAAATADALEAKWMVPDGR